MTYDASNGAIAGKAGKYSIRPKMRLARLGLIGASLFAAVAAMMMTTSLMRPPEAPKKVLEQAALETVDVLVAAADIVPGQSLAPKLLRWQKWIKDEIGPNLIRRDTMPDAIKDNSAAVVRAPMFSGEPVMASKLVNGHDGGFMSILLPSGMRGVSIRISPETGAGGFVLPNDRVDVILTAKTGEESGGRPVYTSSTVLANVQVLAIDQTYEQGDGEKPIAVGKTATLALRPEQTEILAQSQAMGKLSLSLRSHADIANVDRRARPETPRFVEVHKLSKGSMTTTKYNVSSPGFIDGATPAPKSDG